MKALALLSGGFDSAVAIKLMQNKLEIIALHFSLEPFTDDTPEKKSLELAKKLEGLQTISTISKILNIAKRTATNYVSLLRKNGYINETNYGSRKIRMYKIKTSSFSNALKKPKPPCTHIIPADMRYSQSGISSAKSLNASAYKSKPLGLPAFFARKSKKLHTKTDPKNWFVAFQHFTPDRAHKPGFLQSDRRL